MQTLTLTDFGVYLGKHSERVTVKKGKETLSEHPLMNLEQILIASRGVSLSSDLVSECVERGIPITYLAFNGKPYAKIVSPALTATVKTRREQLAAYNDERGVEAAKRFGAGKVQNQINLLRYCGKYRKQAQPEVFAQIEGITAKLRDLLGELEAVPAPCIDEARSTLLNLEGRAAALYWEGFRQILPEGVFGSREHRGTQDPVNSLLNYGYGILYSQVWGAISRAGLEPFAGFLHVDRPGKPSLVLDLIEEFRQPVVDRCVIALLNKGFKVEMESPDSEELKARHVGEGSSSSTEQTERRLSGPTRKAFAQKVLERLEDEEPFEKKRRKLKHIIQLQARHLAVFLRREGEYKGYVLRW